MTWPEPGDPNWIPWQLRDGGRVPGQLPPDVRSALQVHRGVRLLLVANEPDRAAEWVATVRGPDGALAAGLIAQARGEPGAAAQVWRGLPVWMWSQLVPVAYLGSQLVAGDGRAWNQLADLVGNVPLVIAPDQWSGLLLLWLAHGGPQSRGQVESALARLVRRAADQTPPDPTPPDEHARRRYLQDYLRLRAPAPSSWRDQPTPPAAWSAPRRGSVDIALLDYRHPDRRSCSPNLGDHIQTLAVLTQLARFPDVDFEGEPGLVELLASLRLRIPPDRLVRGAGRVRLHAIDRDAPSLCPVPDGTWLVAAGWFQHPLVAGRRDFPPPAAVRPIYLSWHLAHPELLTPESVAHLAAHSPVGCRDLATRASLERHGVPAFFSGCLTMTLGLLGRRDTTHRGLPGVAVDAPAPRGYDIASHIDPTLGDRDLATNLRAALAALDRYRQACGPIITSRLHCYLPARAMGCDPRLTGGTTFDPRYTGLVGLSDEEFAGISGQLDRAAATALAGAILGVGSPKWQ